MESQLSTTEQIEAEGPGDWTDHEAWESTSWWAKKMRAEERIAAKLLASGVQPERIEQMMELPSGEIEKWCAENEDFLRAAKAAYWDQRERSARPDPVKALTPKQLKAAEVYFVDAASQKETGRAVGVSDRTIRNWLHDPVFVFYGKQLLKERSDVLAREQEEQQGRMRARYLAQIEKAQEVIEEKLEEKDATVALAIARSYMRAAR